MFGGLQCVLDGEEDEVGNNVGNKNAFLSENYSDLKIFQMFKLVDLHTMNWITTTEPNFSFSPNFTCQTQQLCRLLLKLFLPLEKVMKMKIV